MTSKKLILPILVIGLVMAVSGCITSVEQLEVVDVGEAQFFRQSTFRVPIGGQGSTSPFQYRDVSISAEGIKAVSASGCGASKCVTFVDANDSITKIDTYILVSGCQPSGYLYKIPAGRVVANPIPVHVGSLARSGCNYDLTRDPPAEGIQVMTYKVPTVWDYYR